MLTGSKSYRLLLILMVISLIMACTSPSGEVSNSAIVTSTQEPASPQETAPVISIAWDKPESYQVQSPENISAETAPAPVPSEDPDLIHFKSKDVRTTERIVQLVIEADEIAKLDELLDLVELDLSGSTCYDQILAYKEAHPEVRVHYTVDLGGIPVSNEAESVTVHTLSDPANLSYLPDLKSLTIEEPMSPEAASLLVDSVSLEKHYSVSVSGTNVSSDTSTADFSNTDPSSLDEIINGISALPNLTHINLMRSNGTSAWTLEQASALQKSKPELAVDYKVNAFGKTFSLSDEVVDFSGISMKSKKTELRNLLPYLSGVKELYLDNCGLSNEELAALRSEFPSPKIVWLVKVGAYTCHTNDVMIKFSAGESKTLLDKDVTALKYCNEIRFLDLGHNHLRHIGFVANMPDLEVCIIAVNYLIDITGIENCKKLEYCEFLSGIIKDISPLAACTELKHLNISFNLVSDISPLYGLTKLERLWISRNNIPSEQIAHIRELLPNCEINTTTHNPTGEGWRHNPRYDLLKEQFIYDNTHIRSYNAAYLAEMKFSVPTPTYAPAATPAPDTVDKP